MTQPTAGDDKRFHGPAWDLSAEYPGVSSPELAKEIALAEGMIVELEGLGKNVAPKIAAAAKIAGSEAANVVAACQKASRVSREANKLFSNISTFLSCELSVDAKNAAAKSLNSRVNSLRARLSQATNPFDLFLTLTSDTVAENYLADEFTRPERFTLMQERKRREFALSLPEEDLAIALSTDGIEAWGNLYFSIAGTTRCDVELKDGVKSMGLAEVSSLGQSEDENVRRAAYHGAQKAWEKNEEAVAAGLNALAGWRHTVYKKRSHTKPMHFLDLPLHQSRIERATLDAMLTAATEARDVGRKSLGLQATLLGKEKMAPWDLFAPCPQKAKGGVAVKAGGGWKKPTFDEAVELIATAYSSVHPEMGDFVRMMSKNKWIEGRVGPTKSPGAYCTGFAKSRTPRVYMTFNGGMREVMTLAHELGHAFHSWVMRDMPVVETHYPMTLAETASIFGETVVNNYLAKSDIDDAAKLAVAWTRSRDVDAFILNIPARYTFEKSFYEKRPNGALNPDDFKQLTKDAWSQWYGDALAEYDQMFWASKLHFSISDLSFYNYPYTFGYLFALGVYAQREPLGPKFFDAYKALLRDTGRMTAEEVAAKHLNADLTKPDFWRQSLKISKAAVDHLEVAVNAAMKS